MPTRACAHLRSSATRSCKPKPPRTVPALPGDPVDLENPFGRYRLAVSINGDGFRVEREPVLLPLEVMPDRYAELVTFLTDVHRGDATAVTFRRAGP